MTLLAGFDPFDVTVASDAGGEIVIHGATGGEGPPLLLLHGYPQTHAIWHRVAPTLAERFTVVATDLRGYGDSGVPDTESDHRQMSKRAMAADQVAAMRALGFERFGLVGHDRGGRVGHRLALDHRDAVTKLAVLDIAPTHHMYTTADMDFATAYYHWFFLIQEAPLPETMIGADPRFWLESKVGQWGRDRSAITEAAFAEYLRCLTPATIHASCEDYRASAGIDLEHDDADMAKPLEIPLLALWGGRGYVGRRYDVLASWRQRARDVRGHALDCGHYLPEEGPEATLAALLAFFGDDP